MHEISLVNSKSNIDQFYAKVFDLDNNLSEEISSLSNIVSFSTPFKVSKVLIIINSTFDSLPPRFVELSVISCKSHTTFHSTKTSSFTSLPSYSVSTFENCVYSPWSEWTECSSQCGTKTRSRYRNVLKGVCHGDLLEYMECHNINCSCSIDKKTFYNLTRKDIPLNLIVGWINQDNNTYQSSLDTYVYVDDYVSFGTLLQVDNCTHLLCEKDGFSVSKSNCSSMSKLVFLQKFFYLQFLFISLENCEWLTWSEWSDCSSSCQNPGIQYRTRSQTPVQGSGLNCNGSSIETKVCLNECKCELSEWEQWSPCSKSCGGGLISRKRKVISNNGSCNSTVETQICNPECCPIEGRWSSWNQWSECSVSCNSGLRKRIRNCNSPRPDCNGAPCNGSDFDVEVCNTQPCGMLNNVKKSGINSINELIFVIIKSTFVKTEKSLIIVVIAVILHAPPFHVLINAINQTHANLAVLAHLEWLKMRKRSV